MACWVLLLAMLTFTPTEEAALRSAEDHSARLDEGALYPLLRDAVTDPTPDYTALQADPARFRGQRFVVRGRFLVSQPMNLARSGPWGTAAQRWVVQVGETDDDVAVVIVTAPDGEPVGTPRVKTSIALPARFYKIWTTPDTHGDDWDFPVFVGPVPAAFLGGSPSDREGSQTLGPLAMAVVVLLVAFISLIALQVIMRVKARQQRDARWSAYHARSTDAPPIAPPPGDLPTDPAEALDALARQRDAAGDTRDA